MTLATRRAFFGSVLVLGGACLFAGCGSGTGDVAPTTEASKNKHLQEIEEAKKKGPAKKKA